MLTEGWSFNDRKYDVEKHLNNWKNPDICKKLLIIWDDLFGPANLDRDTLALAEILKQELSLCISMGPNPKMRNNAKE